PSTSRCSLHVALPIFLIHQRQLRYQYILSLIVPLFHSPHTLSFIIVEVTKSWKKNCGQFFCQQYKLRVEVIGLTKKDTKQHFFRSEVHTSELQSRFDL